MFKSLSESATNMNKEISNEPHNFRNNGKNEVVWKILLKLTEENKAKTLDCLKLQSQLKESSKLRLIDADFQKENLILKNKLTQVEEDLRSLKLENESFQNGIKTKYQDHVNLIKSDYEAKIEDMQSTITELKALGISEEAEFHFNNEKLQNETATRYDEMKLKMENLLRENENKLREANTSNNILRQELIEIKQSTQKAVNASKESALKKIHALEDEILLVNNRLRVSQERLLEKNSTGCSKCSTYIPKSQNDFNYDHTKTIKGVVYTKFPTTSSNEVSVILNESPKLNQDLSSSKKMSSASKKLSSTSNLRLPILSKNSGYLNTSASSNIERHSRDDLFIMHHSAQPSTSNTGFQYYMSTGPSSTPNKANNQNGRFLKPLISLYNGTNLKGRNYLEHPVKEPRKSVPHNRMTVSNDVIPPLRQLSSEIYYEEKQVKKKRKLITYVQDDV